MPSTATKTGKSAAHILDVDKIKPIEGLNPRDDLEKPADEFAELVASIKQHGVLQPVLVGARKNGHWPLIAGHRRLAAASKAGLKEIPALEAPALEGTELEAAIAENMHRTDLGPIEEAKAIRRLRQERKLKQTQVAKLLGKSERWVRNREKLLELPEPITAAMEAGKVPLEAQAGLAAVAKVSTEAAVKIAKEAVDEHRAGDLVDPATATRDLEDLATGGKVPLQKVTPDAMYDYGSKPSELLLSDEDRKEIDKAWKELGTIWGQRPKFKFNANDAKLAKKRGCLVVFKGHRSYEPEVRFITDPEFVAERCRAKLKTIRAEVAKHEKAQASSGNRREDNVAQREREAKKREKQEEQARNANLKLGEQLRELDLSKVEQVETVRLVCAMALGHEDTIEDVLLAGLAECDPTYRPSEEDEEEYASDRIVAELVAAKSIEECLAIVAKVVVGYQFAQLVRPGFYGGYGLPGPNESAYSATEKVEELGSTLLTLPKAHQAALRQKVKEREERRKREEAEEKAMSEGAEIRVLYELSQSKTPKAKTAIAEICGKYSEKAPALDHVRRAWWGEHTAKAVDRLVTARELEELTDDEGHVRYVISELGKSRLKKVSS